MSSQQAEERQKQIERLCNQIINALADTIDAKDSYTNGHSRRVAQYSVQIAKRAGKSKEEQEHIHYFKDDGGIINGREE
jgi:putative two-component system response regulator